MVGELKAFIRFMNPQKKDLSIEVTSCNTIVEKVKRVVEDNLNIKY